MTAIAGLIYAGGKSSRFGADKATALLQDKRLIDHVAVRLDPQVSALAIAGSIDRTGLPCLDDGAHTDKGPLAGLLAGLTWAASLPDIACLVTAPCDVPLLPKNLVGLLTPNSTNRPTVLNVEGRWQTGCALWPTSGLPVIAETLATGQDLSLHSALRALNVEVIECDPALLDGSFANINTQDDLAHLERRLSQSHG
ncbi:MAG: molybdenum cofactor guanylyltransferase [Rhodobiaceae bacterium]|nr:molybdenum cofactor guanylyltransferase [Rhodobiaceae bacterium]